MVSSGDKGRLNAIGRIFSGEIKTGESVVILGNGEQLKGKDLIQRARIQRIFVSTGKRIEILNSVPAGNVIGISGLDGFVMKTATLSGGLDIECYPLKGLSFSVSPCVRIAVDCVNPMYVPKLSDAMNRLARSDPLVICENDRSGQHIISGSGELRFHK
jgi:elongation factor 2